MSARMLVPIWESAEFRITPSADEKIVIAIIKASEKVLKELRRE